MTVLARRTAVQQFVPSMPMVARIHRFGRAAIFATIVFLLMASHAQAQTESVEFYGLDALGSVRVVFDANGVVVGRMDYGPFGESLSAATAIPKRAYAGLSRDGEAGLDYAKARSYQSRSGRFSTVDAAYGGTRDPQSWNRYAYASNNPLGFVDPSGNTQQAVSCGAGPQWCPGNIQIVDGTYINVNGQFDPSAYGYHGGDAEKAEAAWGAALDTQFMINAIVTKIDQFQARMQERFETGVTINGKKIDFGKGDYGTCVAEGGCKMGVVMPPWVIGRLGEVYVKNKLLQMGVQVGEKVALLMAGAKRIPDGTFGNILTEVKNVSVLNWTPQLQAYAEWARQNGGMLNVYVRYKTELSSQALAASALPWVRVIPFMPW